MRNTARICRNWSVCDSWWGGRSFFVVCLRKMTDDKKRSSVPLRRCITSNESSRRAKKQRISNTGIPAYVGFILLFHRQFLSHFQRLRGGHLEVGLDAGPLPVRLRDRVN